LFSTPNDAMPSVLILCTGNSCRSQMAEVIWKKLGGQHWTVASAGSKPSGYVHPLSIRVMQELDLPVTGLTSKSVDQFLDQTIDLAITVCDNAATDCPTMPGVAQILHWPFDDPANATGSEEEQLVVFRKIRDQIQTKVSNYLSQNPHSDQP